MTPSKSDVHAYLHKLHRFIEINSKAKTPRQIGLELGIPSDFVEQFLAVLDSTDYYIVAKSPSGRFKRASFNNYSKNIFYRDTHYALKRGRLVIGDNRSIFYKFTNYDKQDLAELEDQAVADGAYYVWISPKVDLFTRIFIKEMGLSVVEGSETVSNEFEGYPLVEAEVTHYTSLVNKLKKEVQEELALNLKNKQWFEEEHRKAQLGLRRKNEAYSVVVGQERSVSVSYSRYWFDDEPAKEYTEHLSPKYETRYRSVVDWPSKPDEENAVQAKNGPLIQRYTDYLKQLSQYKILNEKRLAEAKAKDEQLALLQKQKADIELQIKRLR